MLWDTETRQIVSNESGDLLRMLGAFDAFAENDVDLYPHAHRREIDALNELMYDELNNGVYEAGFSANQAAYEQACNGVFAVLDELEERLASTRYLVGDTPTEADWRLFPTLVRFDTVYYLHFKCNLRRIVDYPNLWGYTRDLYQLPGIAETVDMDQIKRHYYTTHDMINPSRIIPAGPELDFSRPARPRLGLVSRSPGTVRSPPRTCSRASSGTMWPAPGTTSFVASGMAAAKSSA